MDSLKLQKLLIETADILNESIKISSATKINEKELKKSTERINKKIETFLDTCKLLKDVERPKGVTFNYSEAKTTFNELKNASTNFEVAIARGSNENNDKKWIREVTKYTVELNKISKKYGWYITKYIDKDRDGITITIFMATEKKF